jgi:hypothetical protein
MWFRVDYDLFENTEVNNEKPYDSQYFGRRIEAVYISHFYLYF